MLAKITIILVPTIAYFIFWLWANRLVNSKIKNNEIKKKYKQSLNKKAADVFAPIFLIAVIIILLFFIDKGTHEKNGFDIFIIVLKFVLLIPLLGIAKIQFGHLKKDIANLKNKTETEIIETFNL